MKIVVGREEGTHRLHVTIGGSDFNLGAADSVPQSVSRQHCQLTIEADGTMTLHNLKDRNVTYVDGLAIIQKQVTPISRIELGSERYRLDLQQILSVAKAGRSTSDSDSPKQTPPIYSLRPLKSLWDEYDKQRLQMQVDEQKRANWQRFQGILSMLGMLCFFIESLQWFRFVLVVIAVLFAAYFFIRGRNTQNSLIVKLHNLENQFRDKYLCPNPTCHRTFGTLPYSSIEYTKSCPACGCKYTH